MHCQFGEKLRTLRGRQLKREQIPIFADILKADTDELLTLLLAYPIYEVVKDEKMANHEMQVVERKIISNRKKKDNSGNK